jgi:hypothetical protein
MTFCSASCWLVAANQRFPFPVDGDRFERVADQTIGPGEPACGTALYHPAMNSGVRRGPKLIALRIEGYACSYKVGWEVCAHAWMTSSSLFLFHSGACKTLQEMTKSITIRSISRRNAR